MLHHESSGAALFRCSVAHVAAAPVLPAGAQSVFQKLDVSRCAVAVGYSLTT
ncbi:MAG: hypothetical protein QOD35_2928 [Nocardioidaceae bacterium]|jgi:hypothetical protein|nr:hypothetical protein [Nocardioidaceae bacterium]